MATKIGRWMAALTVIAVLAIPGRAAAQHQNGAGYPYVLVDIGTFGGPNSYLDMSGLGGWQNSNAQGAVIGSADTSTPDPFAPNCFNPDCFVSPGFVWQHGDLTKLESLPGGSSNGPYSINASGLMAGVSTNGVADPLTGHEEDRAVVWQHGQIHDLGTLPGGHESFAFVVNDLGQVAGPASNTIPDPFSLFGWGTQTRAVLWQDGVMRNLGTLGGPDSMPVFLNNQGQIAGYSFTNATPNLATGQPTQDPFLWEQGHLRDLGGLGGTLGFPNALNSQGEVVGFSDLAGDRAFHPFLWDGQALEDLGTLGGDYGSASWLNEAGDIAGWATLPGNATAHAVLWRHGAMTDLGTVPGQPCSFANSINARDQVVGGSCTSGANGWLWEHGTISDLNTLIAPTDVHVTQTFTINNQGEIVGVGTLPNGNVHVVVLVPAGLAASEGITSNAPAPGTVPPTVATRTTPARCDNPLLWRAHRVDRHPLPCFGI